MKKIALAALMLAGCLLPASGAGYSFLNVGIDYFNQGRYGDAVTWLDKAIAAGDLVPDQMRVAYYDRAVAHERLGEFSSAASDYTGALALKPNDGALARRRAFAFMAAGQYEDAISDLHTAHLKYPQDLLIDLQTGLVDWRLGHYEDARIVFARLTKRATTAWLWLQLANVKSKMPLASIEDENFDPKPWPNPLKALYAGKLDEEAVLKAQQDSPAMACDADFYVGEWRLVHEETAGGLSLIQKAAELCVRNSNERAMALFEIKKFSESKK